MMKGRLLTATLVSQKKKLERDKRVRVTGVGSLLLPSDPLSSTLTSDLGTKT